MVVPPIPSKRRSTPSWSSSERSDPGSPTEKLLSIRGGYSSSVQGIGGDAPSPVTSQLGGSPYGSRLAAGSPSRPTATPSPTLSQIVLKTHSPARPGTDSSRGSTPTSGMSSSGPAAASQPRKPKVPLKPKPAIPKKPQFLMTPGRTHDQVSLSGSDLDDGDSCDDDAERSASLEPELTTTSPDVLSMATGGHATALSGGANALFSDDCSTDAEEWSLTSGLDSDY